MENRIGWWSLLNCSSHLATTGNASCYLVVGIDLTISTFLEQSSTDQMEKKWMEPNWNLHQIISLCQCWCQSQCQWECQCRYQAILSAKTPEAWLFQDFTLVSMCSVDVELDLLITEKIPKVLFITNFPVCLDLLPRARLDTRIQLVVQQILDLRQSLWVRLKNSALQDSAN